MDYGIGTNLGLQNLVVMSDVASPFMSNLSGKVRDNGIVLKAATWCRVHNSRGFREREFSGGRSEHERKLAFGDDSDVT
jgi:hypothetical protein